MDPQERAHIEHVAERVRTEFAAARERREDDAQALQSVAIELELSLEDCATALGREDLLDRLGTSWELDLTEPPAHGQRDIRRCVDVDLDLLTALWPVHRGVHEAHHSRQLQGRSE